MADMLTPVGRGSFVNVFEPQAAEGNDKAYWGLDLLFPKDAASLPETDPKSLKPLEKALQAFVLETYGSDKDKWPEWAFTRDEETGAKRINKKKLYGLKPQAEKMKYTGYEAGAVFLSATLPEKKAKGGFNAPPAVYYGRRGKDGKLVRVTDQTDIYGGAWYQLHVRPYWRTVQSNPGLSFALIGVVKIADDEPFAGAHRSTESAFEAVQFAAAEGFSAGEQSASDLFE